MTAIATIVGREILDSRGNPTVEVDVVLENGAFGRAAVPSGASTGAHEAHELRDGGKRYGGKGVRQAVEAVNGEIGKALKGTIGRSGRDRPDHSRSRRHREQEAARRQCTSRRVTRRRQGVARRPQRTALSLSRRHASDSAAGTMMNIFNGGAHADNPIDVQEFMIAPAGAPNFAEALRMGAEIFHALKAALKTAGHTTAVGDEGGFAPNLASTKQALDFVMAAIGAAGFKPGADMLHFPSMWPRPSSMRMAATS